MKKMTLPVITSRLFVALIALLVVLVSEVDCFSTSSGRRLGRIQQEAAAASASASPLPALLAVPKKKEYEEDEESSVNVGLDRRSVLVNVASLAFVTSAAVVGLPVVASAAGTAPVAPPKNKNSAEIPEWTLDGGVKFPTLALNTVGLSVEDTTRAVGLATRAGITHLDFHPGIERDGVAKYIRTNGRKGLFLNTKIRKAPPGTSPLYAAEKAREQISEDLAILGVDSVDMLMVRDSPDCAVIQAQWAVLEEALKEGKTRSIGVINFCEPALKCVLETAKVKPALNYIMLHVGMGTDPRGLRSFGESRGIRTFGYGAVGEEDEPKAELLANPILKRIGDAHKRKPEEVALRWVLQNGNAVSVRPTLDFGLGTSTCSSTGQVPSCEDGVKARAGTFGWSLSTKEMAELDNVQSPNDNPTLFSSTGCPDSFFSRK